MKRSYVIDNLSYKAQEDSKSKKWRIDDLYVGSFLIADVSAIGEISLNTYNLNFPYAKALMGLVQLENRRLSICVPNKMRRCQKEIESIENCEKVPCSGVSFRIYYLNP